MPIDADRRRKLVGLLGRLGSDNYNERLAAVRLIEAGRKALGMQWDELIVPPVRVVVMDPIMDFNTAPRRPSVKPGSGMVHQVFDTLADFVDLIDAAGAGASTSKEMDFVADMRMRAETYRDRAFISEAQLNWLRALADRA